MSSSTSLNVVLVLLHLVVTAWTQRPGLGGCPSVKVMENFDSAKYLGKWYEIEKIMSWFQNGICAEANYGPVDNEGRIAVVNKELVRGRVVGISGVAYMASEEGEARLKVEFDIPIVGRQTSDYWVLGSDYNTFAVVWACRDFGGILKFESAWILSRERNVTSEAQEEIDKILAFNHINKSGFQKTVYSPTVCPNLDDQSFAPFSYAGQ